MAAYIIRKSLQSILIFFLMTLLIFFTIRIIVGLNDSIIPNPIFADFDSSEIEQYSKEYHVYDPLIIQYGYWMADVFRGDLGTPLYEY